MCDERTRAAEDEVIAQALAILRRRTRKGAAIGSPRAVREYLQVQNIARENEIFSVIFLDAQNRIISKDEMFTGTITSAAVYPREIVKAAMRYNAAAVILAHNHPSGISEPSSADASLTKHIKAALALVEVRVLDHFVIGAEGVSSFAENGLI